MINPKHFRRYREIASVLAKNGFGYVIGRLVRGRSGGADALDASEAVPSATQAPSDSWLGERLRLTFEELGPTFVKLGQLMSTRSDMFSPGIIAELKKLQDEVRPFSFDQAREVVESELGSDLRSLFVNFSREPFAAASIGQVHRATLPDGQQVAVKVQRPGILETIEADLDIIFDLARLAARHLTAPGVENLPDMVEEFARSVRLQLDYTAEGRNADRFAGNFKDNETVRFPRVYWDYTTRKVLTMEYVEGVNLKNPEFLDKAGISRYEVARTLASAILDQILVHGLFHADPHPSNIVALPKGIAFLDFGMVGRVSEERRSQFVKVLIGLIRGNASSLVRSMQDMGILSWDADTAALKVEIENLRERYYDCPLREIRISDVMSDYMKIAYRFKLRIPSEFAMVLRSLATTEGVVSSLDPSVSVMELARPIAERLVKQQLEPQHLLAEALSVLRDYGELIRDFPNYAHSILRGFSGGQFKVRADPEELASLFAQARRITSVFSRSIVILALSILLAGIAVAFSVRPELGRVGYFSVYLGLGLSVALLIWLVVSMIRSR